MAKLILVRSYTTLQQAELRAAKINARGKATMIKYERVACTYISFSRLESLVDTREWRHVLYIVE